VNHRDLVLADNDGVVVSSVVGAVHGKFGPCDARCLLRRGGRGSRRRLPKVSPAGRAAGGPEAAAEPPPDRRLWRAGARPKECRSSPGHSAFTLMPSWAWSVPSPSQRAYRSLGGRVQRPVHEPGQRNYGRHIHDAAASLAAMWGMAAREQFATPSTFTSKTLRHSSRPFSVTLPTVPIPATLQSTFTAPVIGSGPVYRLANSGFVADVDGLRGELARGHVGSDDYGSLRSEPPASPPPRFRSCSGDDCDCAKALIHVGHHGRILGVHPLSYSLRRSCPADSPATTAR
jgi:hypothetical protein